MFVLQWKNRVVSLVNVIMVSCCTYLCWHHVKYLAIALVAAHHKATRGIQGWRLSIVLVFLWIVQRVVSLMIPAFALGPSNPHCCRIWPHQITLDASHSLIETWGWIELRWSLMKKPACDRLVRFVQMILCFILSHIQVNSVQAIIQSTHFNNLFLYRKRGRLIYNFLLFGNSWFNCLLNDLFKFSFFFELLKHFFLFHVYLVSEFFCLQFKPLLSCQ